VVFGEEFMINVTKTYLPNINRYKKYIDEIFKSGWITNNGKLVRLLEERLVDYLGVKNVVLVSNGTTALEIAYRTLDIKGYAVTTPFSFVATTSSLVTNNIKPIFADINRDSLTIDPLDIKNVITRNTSAIVPVHVFGNCCNIEEIDHIAKENNLKVIYDAAHAFGVKYRDKNILNYGDISILSFHATKLFHTIEGGALIINDEELVQKARYLINFGIKNEEFIPELGTNAKMNEFEAAMGLCILDEIENIITLRKELFFTYEKELTDYIETINYNSFSTKNYGYFPILLKDEKQLLKVKEALNNNSIYPRRYFYPSLDSLDYIEPKQYCQISRDVSKKILVLPLYPYLEKKIQRRIIDIVKENI
jgi:dTDP-4-amino-4,6-dideoxygalactose transaminase